MGRAVYGSCMQPVLRPDRLAAPVPPPWVAPWWIWPIAGMVIFGIEVVGVAGNPAGSNVIAWWPGAGLCVLFVLMAGARRRWTALTGVFVVTVAATLIGGREPTMSALFGAATVVETAIITLVLQWRGRSFRLGRTLDALHFIVAVALGASVIGMTAGVTAIILDGNGFVESALHAAVSHAAAVLLIAPFGALPSWTSAKDQWAEILVQSVLLVAAVGFVFAPGSYLPLGFLVFAFIAWAGFRFPMPIALAQALAVSVAVLLMTLAGGGPFLTSGLGTHELMMVVEAYMVVLATITILLVTARYELRQATRTALNVSQLITGGFLDSRVGLLIAEDGHPGPQVLWANRAGIDAIAAELSDDDRWQGPLASHAQVSISDGTESMYNDPATGATINLVANRIAGDHTRFAVQLVDVTVAIRTAHARHDAELERAAAQRTRIDLERQRDDFVATTSHELRTPITSIAGYTELLLDSTTLGVLERSWAQVIARNTERLADLADDLLTLARARAHPQIERQPSRRVRLRDVVDEVVTLHRPMADAKSIALAIDVDPDAEAICAPADLSRALGNLVSNAITFTPAGGDVRIAHTIAEGRPAIRVSDSGPGMTPEILAHAVERFYRGPDAERDNTPGTGLGLAVAAELAARNGGAIRLSSPPGGGVEATIVLRDQGRV